MNVSEYIVSFIADHGINDIFGFQGTMIATLVDAICKNSKVCNHSCYNEQGAAFAAVGYAKESGKTAFAYATSGPGAINLLSGIADAYFDSVPTIFITGQLNTNEYTDIPGLRQQGFQQANVVEITKTICKYSVEVSDASMIRYELEKAFYLANHGRKGPVVIDLPMNIQRMDIEPDELVGFSQYISDNYDDAKQAADKIVELLNESKFPMLLTGNAIVKGSPAFFKLNALIEKLKIPVMTSMLARHLFDWENEYNFGYLGAAYGHRSVNLLSFAKADLIVCIGSSFCKRQTGVNSRNYAVNAKIIRIDLDKNELLRKVHDDEISFRCDCDAVLDFLINDSRLDNFDRSEWLTKAKKVKELTDAFDNVCDERSPNRYISALSDVATDREAISCDVGQHQVWTAQSFKVHGNQRLLFSGGHGAMGFALPAAIGAFYSCKKPTVAICGDGAFQMNIQELQWIAREKLPVAIIIFNNNSLGLIKQQQNDFFDGNHFGSANDGGYNTPDFVEIAKAYKIAGYKAESVEQMVEKYVSADGSLPFLIEVSIDSDSLAVPKTYFGEKMCCQKPYLPNETLREIYHILDVDSKQ